MAWHGYRVCGSSGLDCSVRNRMCSLLARLTIDIGGAKESEMMVFPMK